MTKKTHRLDRCSHGVLWKDECGFCEAASQRDPVFNLVAAKEGESFTLGIDPTSGDIVVVRKHTKDDRGSAPQA